MKSLFTKISPVVLEMGRRLKEGDNAHISPYEGFYYFHFGNHKFMVDTMLKTCTEDWMTRDEVYYLCKCAAPIIKEMNEQIALGTRASMEAHWNEILFGEKK